MKAADTPSAENAPPLTVQAQDGAVLIEDHDRNLSVLALTTPLHITCPWGKQRWCFHTQAQLDMFQRHLNWHASQQAGESRQRMSDFNTRDGCFEAFVEQKRRADALEKELAAEKTKHVRFMVAGGPVVMASEYDTLKAREAATIATVNAAWADTVAALTAERDALKDAIA